MALLLALAGGLLTGLFFFGGLWYTTHRALTARMPAAWFLLSFMVRVAVTIGSFFILTRGAWLPLVLCLAGFVAGRVLVTQWTRTRSKPLFK